MAAVAEEMIIGTGRVINGIFLPFLSFRSLLLFSSLLFLFFGACRDCRKIKQFCIICQNATFLRSIYQPPSSSLRCPGKWAQQFCRPPIISIVQTQTTTLRFPLFLQKLPLLPPSKWTVRASVNKWGFWFITFDWARSGEVDFKVGDERRNLVVSETDNDLSLWLDRRLWEAVLMKVPLLHDVTSETLEVMIGIFMNIRLKHIIWEYCISWVVGKDHRTLPKETICIRVDHNFFSWMSNKQVQDNIAYYTH